MQKTTKSTQKYIIWLARFARARQLVVLGLQLLERGQGAERRRQPRQQVVLRVEAPQAFEALEALGQTGEAVVLQVRRLQTGQLAERGRQRAQLVPREVQGPQPPQPTEALREARELVVLQAQGLQLREPAEARGQGGELVPLEVQRLQLREALEAPRQHRELVVLQLQPLQVAEARQPLRHRGQAAAADHQPPRVHDVLERLHAEELQQPLLQLGRLRQDADLHNDPRARERVRVAERPPGQDQPQPLRRQVEGRRSAASRLACKGRAGGALEAERGHRLSTEESEVGPAARAPRSLGCCPSCCGLGCPGGRRCWVGPEHRGRAALRGLHGRCAHSLRSLCSLRSLRSRCGLGSGSHGGGHCAGASRGRSACASHHSQISGGRSRCGAGRG